MFIIRNTVIPFLIGITWLCNIVHRQAWAIISLFYGISDSWLARHMAMSLWGWSRLSIWQTSGTGEFFLVILGMFLKLGIEIIMLSIFTFFNWPLDFCTIRLPSKTSVYRVSQKNVLIDAGMLLEPWCTGSITSGWHHLGLKSVFGRFLLRLSRIKRPQVMSMVKFSSTALNFGYDFVL